MGVGDPQATAWRNNCIAAKAVSPNVLGCRASDCESLTRRANLRRLPQLNPAAGPTVCQPPAASIATRSTVPWQFKNTPLQGWN
ncbi:hypothetical protein GCM10017056_47440 [Seohaeicola zhoushanensis]|uniref:Uncharacterized protein n=1 Tax=Seohaeicola zhoushanensis TaxID=1569283 RepID=A0A8J3H3B4_9RHOB|nr:hypothetical protein GCM10017056_47440 [Seohaeicola zhoushanensis]